MHSNKDEEEYKFEADFIVFIRFTCKGGSSEWRFKRSDKLGSHPEESRMQGPPRQADGSGKVDKPGHYGHQTSPPFHLGWF